MRGQLPTQVLYAGVRAAWWQRWWPNDELKADCCCAAPSWHPQKTIPSPESQDNKDLPNSMVPKMAATVVLLTNGAVLAKGGGEA